MAKKKPMPSLPFCMNCGARRAKKLPHSLEVVFCSITCGADWALERATANSQWCGQMFDANPDSDMTGPHGWFDLSDYPDGCPECEDERDAKATA